MTSTSHMSEEEVTLGHGQLGERLAANLFAIDPDLVGIGVDADLGGGLVALHVLLADRAAALDGHHLALQAVAVDDVRLERGLRYEGEAGLRERPAVGGK